MLMRLVLENLEKNVNNLFDKRGGEKMKKNLPLIILGVVVIIGLVIGGWWFLGRGKQISLPTAPSEVSEQAPAEEGKGFVGKLKDALILGQSMKCTWEKDENNFAISYIKDSKVRTEVTQAGEKAHSIMVDNCTYTWQEGETQGFKMCFEPEEGEEVEEGEEEAMTPEEITAEMPDYEYNCEPAIVPDSMFNPPAEVNFMSMEQMMGGE